MNRFGTTIDNLIQHAPAAVWDSIHDPESYSCCGDFNPGYHKAGYNVLFYDGAVAFMPGNKWPQFPYNMFWDSTDCWGPGTTTINGKFEFWDYADEAR